ncbi:uncharacterized protein LOC108023307 [Drosophila biarmipes]|uniref:uncharacterized protein LOC108023307 n=1 Tax=Drosophila biarmipes TaxID=125945 RepID=UPI0007E8A0D2|nr:uncharacterized protein LOC108023307 [Drosophila biarmipes]
MAKAKVSRWMGHLRDMGRVLRLNFSSIGKARWSLSWIETAKKSLPTMSAKGSPSEGNEGPTPMKSKCDDPNVGLNGIRDLQLNEPSIAKIEDKMTARPQNGFISRALYYRRFYIKR